MLRETLDSLTPGRDFSRRDFVQTAVGSGFAAAALPIVAQTMITTDTKGLTAGPVTVPVGDFKMPAYRSMPEGKTNAPVILVVSEIFGVHEHIADLTRRFAKLGYFAIAPELFVRQGDAKAISDIPTLISQIISKVPDAQVAGDLDATVAWSKANGGDTAKLGITGFCWGGRQTWLYNAHSPAVKAAVAWYGPLVGQPNALQPKFPVDLTGQLHGPTLGLYGGADSGITAEHVRKMKDALAAGNAVAQKSEIVVYPDTPHAFNADYRPTYRKGPADDGWKRALAWFKANGVA